MGKRTKGDIIYRILKSIIRRNGINWTRIIANANLSHDMATKYLHLMVKHKYVHEEERKVGKSNKTRTAYLILPLGYAYIQDYEKMQEKHYGLLEEMNQQW